MRVLSYRGPVPGQGGENTIIRVWDPMTGERRRELEGHERRRCLAERLARARGRLAW
jgi:hypothetical protein